MGTISVSLPADGETIEAADYNTPITTIVNSHNGNIDNANIATNAAIDGSKLADASVLTGKIGTGTVTTGNIASGTIASSNMNYSTFTLGYAQKTSSQGSITNTPTDVTSLSSTVSIPSGTQRIKITVSCWATCTSTGVGVLSIVEGSTQLGGGLIPIFNTTNGMPGIAVTTVDTPSAGSHTYKVMASFTAGTGTIIAGTNASIGGNPPAFILIERVL